MTNQELPLRFGGFITANSYLRFICRRADKPHPNVLYIMVYTIFRWQQQKNVHISQRLFLLVRHSVFYLCINKRIWAWKSLDIISKLLLRAENNTVEHLKMAGWAMLASPYIKCLILCFFRSPSWSMSSFCVSWRARTSSPPWPNATWTRSLSCRWASPRVQTFLKVNENIPH